MPSVTPRTQRRERKITANIPVVFALLCFCLVFGMRNSLIGSLGFEAFYIPTDQFKGSYSPPLKLDPTKFQKAVHLVHTRFMQGQPNMLALGSSRIELLKTFCLPTMANQTTSDFLWIILIDPELDPILLKQLQRLLQPYPHFILYKKLAQEIDLHELNLSLVASGHKNLLLQAAYEAKSKILVQTRLDADDGLAHTYIEQTQRTAVQTLQPSDSSRPQGWIVQCVKKHFEWHYDLQKNETSDLMGWVRMSITPSFCVTPGLTLAVAPGGKQWSKDEPLPIYPHDKITRKFPRCSSDIRTECFHIVNEIRDPAAIRSRTPASSFMRGVGTTETRKTPESDWNIMERDFGIHRETLIQTRNYLMSNVEVISKENLESHCTGINPCWDDRKEKLVALAGNTTDADGHAVTSTQEDRFQKAVHIVHTRFMQGQPDLLALGASRLELFKTFCLPTMVHQTTSDFLWVILVDPFLHPTLLDELTQLVKPYPHFFVIRKMVQDIDLENLDLSLVQAGDTNILKRAARKAKSKILIQTRLDADDGIAINLLDHLQNNAVKTLQHNGREASGWMLLCVRLHVEWHYDIKNKTQDPNGWLRMDSTPYFCVTPGLTLAVAPGAANWTGRSPMYPHDRIMQKYPRCDLKATRSACFHIMSELTEPAAVRSRTPASSFMRGVGIAKKEKETPEEQWQSLGRMFTIQRKTLAETRNYLLGNVQSIAKENLASQCTGMNPCRDGDRKRLSALASSGK